MSDSEHVTATDYGTYHQTHRPLDSNDYTQQARSETYEPHTTQQCTLRRCRPYQEHHAKPTTIKSEAPGRISRHTIRQSKPITIPRRTILNAMNPTDDRQCSCISHHAESKDYEEDIEAFLPSAGGDGAVVH